METRQMTPFFSSTFYALFVTFIFIFGNSQNSFTFGPPFGPFWSVKYFNFGQKSPIQSTHHTFLESRHPEVTKNPYVLSSEWSQKNVSAHGLQCLQIKSLAPKKAGECQFDNLTLSYLDFPKMTFLEKQKSPAVCDFFRRYEDLLLQF